MPINKCVICGKSFYCTPSRGKKGYGKYCGFGCYGKMRSTIYIGAKNPAYKNAVFKKECPVCGKEFETTNVKIKLGRGKYCSKKCATSFKVGENAAHWMGGGIKHPCNICGKPFDVPKNKIKLGHGKYCSSKCYGIWRTRCLGGETLDAKLSIRRTVAYQKWRKSILARDGHKCNVCGTETGQMDVHHIKKYSVLINDIHQKYPLLCVTDLARSDPNLWDINNGITLCLLCHRKKHFKK